MNHHNNTGTATKAATRTLQDVADEMGVPIDWVVEEGAALAHWGWDDRFVEDWDGVNPPPGDPHWSGGCYWDIGIEADWPDVEIAEDMATHVIETLSRQP